MVNGPLLIFKAGVGQPLHYMYVNGGVLVSSEIK